MCIECRPCPSGVMFVTYGGGVDLDVSILESIAVAEKVV